jgi:hypothetical protein
MDLDDPRWAQLCGGYRIPYDARHALRALKRGQAPWAELWENLHHQDDVGEASYAAVPIIARHVASTRSRDWNGYALAATIEAARHEPDNPPIPRWLAADYEQAWRELLEVALELLKDAADRELVLSLFSAVAAANGFPALATASTFDDDELREILERR